MTRIERRVLLNCVLAGTLLTAVVVMLELGGWLQVSENWMYDLRARYFQYFAPPPTDQLVHLDIDDKALEGVGRWPWHRSTMAEMIDEIHLAGAKAVATDILFTDPEEPTYETSQTDNGSTKVVRVLDNDALLADAVKRAGNVLIPTSFELEPTKSDPIHAFLINQLTNDPELSADEIETRVKRAFPVSKLGGGELTNRFLQARRQAVFLRVQSEMTTASLTPDELRRRLMKRTDASVNSPLSRLIDEQLDRYIAFVRLTRFGIKAPTDSLSFLPSTINLPPIPMLSKAAATTAFVDFRTARDGVLRTQPLLLNCEGRLYPQMGLSLALLYLGASVKDLTYTTDEMTIHCPDGRRIAMPISSIYSPKLDREVPAIFNIPWFGNRDWETMYDWPAHAESKQHLTMNTVWDPCLTRHKIIRTNQTADRAIAIVYKYLGMPKPAALAEDDVDGRIAQIDHAFADGKEYLDAVTTPKPSELDDEARMVRSAVEDFATIRRENLRQQAQLVALRAELAKQLKGKAIFIGWTATGHQDAVPTSVHATCPGVVTHGAIFNAIITGHFWTVAPEWMTIALTIVLGWMTAVIAWRFSPLGAFLITSVFGMAYVALNGLYFFDHLGLIIGLAAPQFSMAAVWSGCSLARIVIESSERGRITRQLGRYVDPNVVNFMMEQPDEVHMDGETRELTVCFSDIAGFTALSERLGDGIVPVLNEFMSIMVPVIRSQHGTVDKFLGDGIMFFFGAPVPDPNHAAEAVAAALLMQQALGRFNETLLSRGLPTVQVRVGINTGDMIVGDAGSDDIHDYTVIGDNVNFASRLESANKQLGTSILLSARTAELAGDRFLIRPIGSLQVVGKTEGVATFTVVGTVDGADSKELLWCEKSKQLVNAFRSRDFTTALAAANEIEKTFGHSKVTDAYRDLCEQYLANPPGDKFDGTIVLTEK